MKVSDLRDCILFQSPDLVEWKHEGVLYRFQRGLSRVSVRGSNCQWRSYQLDKPCLKTAKRKVLDLILEA